MGDKTFLFWPFFDDHHREMASALESWAVANVFDESGASELDLSRKYVSKLGDAGWLKYSVPAPFGGKFEKLDVRSLCLTRDILARYSGLLEFAFAMQGLGAGPISLLGTEAQKRSYLPKIAAGEWVAAFAMSEADAGSDVSALKMTAVKDGSDYVLDGEKTWISNAGIADLYVVIARTGEGPGAKGLSAFILTADTPGFSVTEQQHVIAPHPIGSIRLEGCRIPAANLLTEPGKGFKVCMATLDVFRSTVGAAALGFARRALDETLLHTSSRKVFGQALAEFQMTQQKIADMATAIDASALLVYRAAWAKDNGAERITREAAMAKSYATEAAQCVIDQAVQLFGGKGVLKGSIVEHLYRDIRPLRIYEGATEIQKIVISRQVYAEAGDGNA
ncbi:MAG: acyl-CoA dehydrogenase family protein [Bdellovibrionales bacterium]|nr:acyl-CoA dehydrogenase family protein [Bdellovibrionales bacterium]